MQKLTVTPLELVEDDGDMPTVAEEDSSGVKVFDVSEHYLATGTGEGVVKVYDRGQGRFLGSFSSRDSIPASVSTASAAVCHLAVSIDESRLCAVFDTAGMTVVTTTSLLSSSFLHPLHHHTLHGTEVTCIEWASDRVFTGDKGGYVIMLNSPHGDATVALREECALVQISVKQKLAAISTLRRTVLYKITDEGVPPIQVGGQLREGVWGGCLAHGFVYAARPRKDFDARVWKADPDSGAVKKTLMFRHVPDVDSPSIVVCGCSFDLNGVFERVGTHDGKAKYKRVDGGATLYSTAGLWAATDSSKKKVLLKTDDHEGGDVTQMTAWQELQPDETYAVNPGVRIYDELYYNNLSLGEQDRGDLVSHKTFPVPFLKDVEGANEPLLAAWGSDAVIVLNALSVKVVSMKFLRGLIHVVPRSFEGVPVLYTLHRPDKKPTLSTVHLTDRAATNPLPSFADVISPVLKERTKKVIEPTTAPPPPVTEPEPEPEPIPEEQPVEEEPPAPPSPPVPIKEENDDKLTAEPLETVTLGGKKESKEIVVGERKKKIKVVRKTKKVTAKTPSVADLLNSDLKLTPESGFGPQTPSKNDEAEVKFDEKDSPTEAVTTPEVKEEEPAPVVAEATPEPTPVDEKEEKDSTDPVPSPMRDVEVVEAEQPQPPPEEVVKDVEPEQEPEPEAVVEPEPEPEPELHVDPEPTLTMESLAKGPDPLAATMADMHFASHIAREPSQPVAQPPSPQQRDEDKDDCDTPVMDIDINGWKVMNPKPLGAEELQRLLETTDQVHIIIRDYKLLTAFDSMASAQKLRAFTSVTDWVDHLLTILDTDLLLQHAPSSNTGTIASPTESVSLRNKMAVLIDAYVGFKANPSLIYRGREVRPESEALNCTDDNVIVRLLHFMRKRDLIKEISADELTVACANLGAASGNYIALSYLLQGVLPKSRLHLLKGYLPHPQTQYSNLVSEMWNPITDMGLKDLKQGKGITASILRRELDVVQRLENSSEAPFLASVIYHLPYLFAAGSDQAMKTQKLCVKLYPKISWKLVRSAISRNVQEEAHRVLGISWDTNQHWIEYQELYLDYCRFLAEQYPELCRLDTFVGQYINVLVHTITTLPVYQAHHNSVEEAGGGGSPGSPRGAVAQQRDMQNTKLRRLERVLKRIICDTKSYTYNPEEVRSIFIRKKYFSGLLILGKQTPQLMSNIYMQLLQCDQGETLLNYFRDEVGDNEAEWMNLIKTGALLKAEQKGTQQEGGAGPLDYVSYLMCVCLGPQRTMELLRKFLGTEVEFEEFYKKLTILTMTPGKR